MEWEDIRVGVTREHGSREVTEEEIVAFARTYDPQPIHIDPDAAAAGPFGGLIAGGWMTTAIFSSLWVRDTLAGGGNVWSPGIDELRWLVPVRPGDVLTARSRVVDKWPSERDPTRGTILGEYELVNQDGEVVLRMRGRGQTIRNTGG